MLLPRYFGMVLTIPYYWSVIICADMRLQIGICFDCRPLLDSEVGEPIFIEIFIPAWLPVTSLPWTIHRHLHGAGALCVPTSRCSIAPPCMTNSSSIKNFGLWAGLYFGFLLELRKILLIKPHIWDFLKKLLVIGLPELDLVEET